MQNLTAIDFKDYPKSQQKNKKQLENQRTNNQTRIYTDYQLFTMVLKDMLDFLEILKEKRMLQKFLRL